MVSAIAMEAFEHYMGEKRWSDSFKIEEEKGFSFCEVCGKANLLSSTVPTSKTMKMGLECGCMTYFYEELDKKYYHEKILGLKPGWIVLGKSEPSIISAWGE